MVTPCSIPVAQPAQPLVLKHPVLLTSPLPRDAVKTDPTTAAAALSSLNPAQELIDAQSLEEGGDEFLKLLDSLEARVELMAKMQETRQRLQETRDPEAPGSDGGEATNGAQLLYDELHLLAQDQSQTGLTGSEEAEEPEERSWDLVAANQELWEHLDQQEAFLRKANAEILKHREAYLRLEAELQHERQLRQQAEEEWSSQKAQLEAEVQELRNQLNMESTSGSAESLCRVQIQTMQDLAAASVEAVEAADPVEPRFSATCCGRNIELSEDGCLATRTRGSRQSAVFGQRALPKQENGWSYEIVVRETMEGWVGGLGLGVTTMCPAHLESVPDKAWRLPETSIVGYWGCAFVDGKESKISWRSDTLSPGQRVAVLVTDEGDLKILVDRTVVASVSGAVKMTTETKLYPVLDIFAATVAVELVPEAIIQNLTGDQSASTIAPE